jgi:hypothetical protein
MDPRVVSFEFIFLCNMDLKSKMPVTTRHTLSQDNKEK